MDKDVLRICRANNKVHPWNTGVNRFELGSSSSAALREYLYLEATESPGMELPLSTAAL